MEIQAQKQKKTAKLGCFPFLLQEKQTKNIVRNCFKTGLWYFVMALLGN